MQSIKSVADSLIPNRDSSSTARFDGMETPRYECEKCKDEGVILSPDNSSASFCDCVSRKKIARNMKHSRIGMEFRSKTFENFNTTGMDMRIHKAAAAARAYADTFNVIRSTEDNSLGITGAVGSGKTHLLCAVANRLISQGISVLYFNALNGFKEMFARYDVGSSAVEELRWELQSCEVLAFDDIGKGRPDKRTGLPEISRAVYEEIYALIEHRYFNRLPIIWTSEILDELLAVIGEASASRLFEMSKGHLVAIRYSDGDREYGLNYRLCNLGAARA
jgi:DNA replication protein DnaC